MFHWYIGDKSREQSAIFVDYRLHYFCAVLQQSCQQYRSHHQSNLAPLHPWDQWHTIRLQKWCHLPKNFQSRKPLLPLVRFLCRPPVHFPRRFARFLNWHVMEPLYRTICFCYFLSCHLFLSSARVSFLFPVIFLSRSHVLFLIRFSRHLN